MDIKARMSVARAALCVAALLFGSIGCGGGGGSSPPTHQLSGTVTGVVEEGVTVKLSGSASQTTTTDADGAYSFAVPDGSYTVTASLDGYVFAPSSRSATVSGADVSGDDFLAANLYDDFSADPSGDLWTSGLRQVVTSGTGLVLSHSMKSLAAGTSYGVSMQPVTTGEVTTWQADVTLTQADYTSDTSARAGIDLWFQPVADRLASPYNATNALFVRITLENSDADGGLVAKWHLLECTSPDCSTSTGVASTSGMTGNWKNATPPTIELDTAYTVSISVNTSNKQVTYALSGGAYTGGSAYSETVNPVASPPFAIDYSAANFYQARLLADVHGGSSGGGDGAVSAKFANVYVNGSLFDGLTGTSIDNSKWSHGTEGVQRTSGGLQAQLAQSQRAYSVGSGFVDPTTGVGLMAGVQVTSHAHSGGGRVDARLVGTLYNDGSNGSGVAPDTNGVGSEVGDVRAVIAMTDTDVSYAVVRCDTALCSQGGVTFVQDFTSLGTITSGSKHTLAWWWDSGNQLVYFQLDGDAPVAFDPTSAGSGYPVSDDPHIPFRLIEVHAGDTGTSSFDAGASGAVTAVFSDVGYF